MSRARDWPAGFFAATGDSRLRTCDTEGCNQHVSVRFEGGGVGSWHCEPCADKIADAMMEARK